MIARYFSLLAVCWAFLTATAATAQKMEYGLGLGGATYKGDLSPMFNPLNASTGGTIFAKVNNSYATAWRFQATYASLHANGGDSPDIYISTEQPNSFSTPVFEVTGGLEYNFFNFRDPLQKRLRGTPYLYGGLGMFWFRTESPEDLTVPNFQPVVPFGFGYKYRLTKNLNLSAEFVTRLTFTDYLDGVSNTDKRGWQRGWKFTNDWYTYAGVSISYTIYNILCPFDYNK